MKRRSIFALLLLLTAASAWVACKNNPTAPEYNPDIPTQWAPAVTNPFFPLAPGTTWQYVAQTASGSETTLVEVLSAKRMVNGVEATVVHDRVFLNGDLIEDTFDWYVQDAAGNVWYVGEDSKEIENGQVVSTEGSWEWNVDGALPGVIMWADPSAQLGSEYRQEYYEGEAEDWGKVVALDESVTVPYGSFSGCIKTEDWNALEAGTLENKYYCPQIGFTLEIMVSGGNERVELIERLVP